MLEVARKHEHGASAEKTFRIHTKAAISLAGCNFISYSLGSLDLYSTFLRSK